MNSKGAILGRPTKQEFAVIATLHIQIAWPKQTDTCIKTPP